MKKTIAIALTSIMFVSSVLIVSAQEMSNERSINPNLVISTNQNVTIPNNVKHVSIRSSINFDHDASIVWNGGYRYVWGSTQASQGTIKLDSYTRARFEMPWYLGGRIYLDSGREWSINQGKSYAQSGTELYKPLESGVAKTYYGI